MDTKVCLVAWKYASLAIQFAVRRIKTFNGICGVNYHSDFICNLQSLVHTPSENLWCGLLDYVTAYADGRLVFRFKNGSEIEG